MPTAMDSFEVDLVAVAYSLESDHLTYCSMEHDLVMGSDSVFDWKKWKKITFRIKTVHGVGVIRL